MSDPTMLSFWFPKVRDAGLPVPRTEIVMQGMDRGALFDSIGEGDRDPKSPERFAALVRAISDAGSRLGWPCFLRTGLFSGKHSWEDTCFVSGPEAVGDHVRALFTDGECVDLFGLDSSEWVVREMLKTAPMFRAFHGKMPITRERRYFVRDGRVEWRQPYWPPHTILDPDTPDWRSILEADNARMPGEDAELSALSVRANAAVPGFWSVDWLWTTDRGWVLTDMAEGDKSFRWDPSEPEEPPPDYSKYMKEAE